MKRWMLILPLFLAGCDDMEDKLPATSTSTDAITEDDTAEIYILSEGLFNLNNSTLARYSFTTGTFLEDYFTTMNGRGLGDTANDMDIYGSKLYIVVNVSSTVEIVDIGTGLSLAQLSLTDETGSSRQPRAVAFDEGKAYVCSYDGTVARIDTTTMEIDAWATAGRNPEDLCVQDGKLYVSNSGGLDWEGIGVDNTVSVIDLSTFTETKQIEVGPNPGKILPGPDHTVWVAIFGEDIEQGDYQFVEIDSETDTRTAVYDEKVMDFAIDHTVAYLYNYDYQTEETAFKVMDLTTREILSDTFITDGTEIVRPYSIQVNPYSGNIYITEAYNYQVDGDLYCFSPSGEMQFCLSGVGLNPNTVLFRDVDSSGQASESDTSEEEETEEETSAFATNVLDYQPAPTQYMNTTTAAWQDSFTTKAEVLAYASERLTEQTYVTLGAFGGYIVVGFDQPVTNVEGEYDLKIYGNAYYSQSAQDGRLGGSAEPGIVLVSADTNGNGLADDEWYELAGSEYGSENELRPYSITYYRPDPADGDVLWTDSESGEGYVYRNSYHTQDSYYPEWVEEDTLTFSGARLADNAVQESGIWVGYCYDWGYADNHPNSTEGAQFKIDWAVDSDGNSVYLETIDFVRIYTAVNQYAGIMGEISTEVVAIEDLHHND